MSKTAIRKELWGDDIDDDLARMWRSQKYTFGDICEQIDRGEMQIRQRAHYLKLGRRPTKPWQRQSASAHALMELRPKHVVSEMGSREWFEQNNISYIRALRKAHPDREVELRRQTVE